MVGLQKIKIYNMKYPVQNRILLSVLFLVIVIIFNACSNEWTEQKSLTIVQANLAEENPVLYAQYLLSLKSYKNSDHKVVYAWFDNSVKMAATRAQHLSSIPDSIDVVVLMYPDSLCEREIGEMKAISQDKGTKVIYNISYPDIENRYNAKVAAELASTKAANAKDASVVIQSVTQNAGFTIYMTTYVDKALTLSDKYNYDGISVRYDSESLVYMASAVNYLGYQGAFFTKVSGWVNSHKDKMLVYEGKPQYLADKSILSFCKYIVLPSLDATAVNDLTYDVKMAMASGVPSNRFIVTVSAFTLDPTDVKTGYFINDANQSVSAITEAASWVVTPDPAFVKAGLGIYNIQNDYYNTSLIYKFTRAAIGIMNPSPKN
jgi:hypothetical protein